MITYLPITNGISYINFLFTQSLKWSQSFYSAILLFISSNSLYNNHKF